MLKKLSFAVAFLALSFSSFAQHEFKKFRVDIGVGYTIPKGGGGILLAVEPKYSVIPNKLSTGLRFESAAMAKEIEGENASVAATMSYVLTGDYHFTQTTARPFAGVGFGLYSLAAASVSTASGSGSAVSKENKVGGLIRAGLDVAHMRLAVEYNLIPATTAEAYDFNTGTTKDVDIKNGYIGVKFSAYIGGGKKD